MQFDCYSTGNVSADAYASVKLNQGKNARIGSTDASGQLYWKLHKVKSEFGVFEDRNTYIHTYIHTQT